VVSSDLGSAGPQALNQSQIENLKSKIVLIATVRQHALDTFLIAFGNQHVNIKMTLPLVSFLRQDVTRMRVAALNLAGRSEAKSLRRAFMCF
jgi:hypothetical protein